jgi:hypothetical protein
MPNVKERASPTRPRDETAKPKYTSPAAQRLKAKLLAGRSARKSSVGGGNDVPPKSTVKERDDTPRSGAEVKRTKNKIKTIRLDVRNTPAYKLKSLGAAAANEAIGAVKGIVDSAVKVNTQFTAEDAQREEKKGEDNIKLFRVKQYKKIKLKTKVVKSVHDTTPINETRAAGPARFRIVSVKHVEYGTPPKVKNKVGTPEVRERKHADVNTRQSPNPYAEPPRQAAHTVSDTAIMALFAKKKTQESDGVRSKSNSAKDTVRSKNADDANVKTKKNAAVKDNTSAVKANDEKVKLRDGKKQSKDNKKSKSPGMLKAISRIQILGKAFGESINGEASDIPNIVLLPFKMLAKTLLALVLPAALSFLLPLLLAIIAISAILASPLGIFFSQENTAPDTVSIPSVFAACYYEAAQITDAWVNEITQDLQDEYGERYVDINVTITGEFSDPAAVLAVWAVKTAADDDAAEDVITITQSKADGLADVFWDMNSLNYDVDTDPFSTLNDDGEEEVYADALIAITRSGTDWADMPDVYSFSDNQSEMLAELMTTPEYYDMLCELVSSLEVSAEAGKIIAALSADDSVSPERRDVVRAALTLTGKVNYFWGGKSFAIGWDSRWGKITKVTASGSNSTGSYKAFGLDCSGFTGWAFINGFKDTSVFYALGFTADEQHNNAAPISFYNALPGDLAFFPDDSHVGIVVGRSEDSGDLLVVHCSDSGVIISEFTAYGFHSVARPHLFND